MNAALLILALAVSCRLWGWKAGGVKGWLLAVVLAAVVWKVWPAPFAPIPAAVALALAVFLWRDFPRNTLGMAIAPDRRRVPETLAFNLLALAPLPAVLCLGYGASLLVALLGWLSLSLACAALAYLHHRLEPYARRVDPNAYIEFACGGLAGLYVVASSTLS